MGHMKASMDASMGSITNEYDDRIVLLTGGLGFLGSTVLAQLLYKTEVKTVYLLVRKKRSLSAAQRVQDMLCCPLFSRLHQQAINGNRNVFSKVKAIPGDLSQPGLGVTEADAAIIQSSVDIIIHCAANVVLDADIQGTLRDNYLSTQRLMQFSSQFANLRAFVHTSTFFVNNHLPRNSLVKEQIYPLQLQLGGQSVGHKEFVTAVMDMHPQIASRVAAQLMQDLDFTSTYAFGKHLTEQLVSSTCIKPGVAKAIVRPALISGIAGEPYPGWVSGYAGSPGYCMGYALGFFQGTAGVAYASDMVLDLIPCDTVAMMVIAAAAAASHSHGRPGAEQETTIYHASSSESHPYPLPQAFDALHEFWSQNSPPLHLPFTGYAQVQKSHHPTCHTIEWARRIASVKLELLSYVLRLFGKSKEAYILRKSFEAFNVQNTIAYDRSMVCSVSNGRALLAGLSDSEKQLWPIVWESSQMSWPSYSWTFLAGVRGLLFKMKDDIRGVQHEFRFKEAADPKWLSVLTTAAATDLAAGTVDGVATDFSDEGTSDDAASEDSTHSADVAVLVATGGYSSKATTCGGASLSHDTVHEHNAVAVVK